MTAVASPAIRVSRRMANEVGISAEQLQQLMTCSPSPQKRKANKIPIMKKSLNLNKMKDGEKENITDSIFSRDKDTADNFSRDKSVICVPKLKLNSDNNDVYAEESSDVLKDGTNKNLNKPRRRWKVCNRTLKVVFE